MIKTLRMILLAKVNVRLTCLSCFQDTDLAPSDIAAGLALLHQEQDKMEHCRDPDEVLSHSPSSPIVSLYHCSSWWMCSVVCALGELTPPVFFSEGGSGGWAWESHSLYAVCSGSIRMATVRLLKPAHGPLQTQRRLVRMTFASWTLAVLNTELHSSESVFQLSKPSGGVRSGRRRPPGLPFHLHLTEHRPAVQRLHPHQLS